MERSEKRPTTNQIKLLVETPTQASTTDFSGINEVLFDSPHAHNDTFPVLSRQPAKEIGLVKKLPRKS